MNKKGFTLIELLAVIIILGILMIIAIPSVTRYISDSRKSAYVDTAKEIIAGARNKVNDGKLEMFDTKVTYYIPACYIKTENASKSPYGEFTEAYIGVIYDGQGYKYYWISVDDAGQGIKDLILYDKLEADNVESDLTDEMIKNTVEHTVIGDRNKIKILDPTNETWKEPVGEITGHVSENGGSPSGSGSSNHTSVTVVSGTIGSLQIGNELCWGSECFYVISSDNSTNGKTTLLSKYNLKVGCRSYDYGTSTCNDPVSTSEANYGIQDNGDRSYAIMFSETEYWIEGTWLNPTLKTEYSSNGRYYMGKDEYGDNAIIDSTTNANGNPYVYDSNSNLYSFVESYKKKLINTYGMSSNISARIPNNEETILFGCSNNCNNVYDWVKNSNFWTGSAYGDSMILYVFTPSTLNYRYTAIFDMGLGIRPVIEIPTSDIR